MTPFSVIVERLIACCRPTQADTGNAGVPRAAVLVLVSPSRVDDSARILLSVRSRKLRSHSGEVALPGGKMDECDGSLVVTALREAEEEIALPRRLVHVLGQLPPVLSKHRLLVTPVVAVVQKNVEDWFPLCVPHQKEVSAVFTVPLQFFTTTGHWHRLRVGTHAGAPYRFHSFLYPPAVDAKTSREIFARIDAATRWAAQPAVGSPPVGPPPAMRGSERAPWHIWGLTGTIVAEIAAAAYQGAEYPLSLDPPEPLAPSKL